MEMLRPQNSEHSSLTFLSDSLMAYAAHCLERPFSESGFALQDIINQLGKRLGFLVEPGRYRGTKNETPLSLATPDEPL
jgi:hypothetical protein